MMESFQFGSKKISFYLIYSKRRTLGITITPEMNVMVNAPNDTPMEKIKTKLRGKAAWILKQQNFFLSYHPKTPEKKFISGESHLFLGRQYLLKVKIGKSNQVKRIGTTFQIVTENKINAGPLLKKWYREQAEKKFAELIIPLMTRFRKYSLPQPKLTVTQMATRWGSCTAKGKIILNPELIKAPKGCIEYVINHELCHLVHREHSQKFMDLQSRTMRDWPKWKAKLEKLLA